MPAVLGPIEQTAAVDRLSCNQEPSRRRWERDIPFVRLDPACFIVRLFYPQLEKHVCLFEQSAGELSMLQRCSCESCYVLKERSLSAIVFDLIVKEVTRIVVAYGITSEEYTPICSDASEKVLTESIFQEIV